MSLAYKKGGSSMPKEKTPTKVTVKESVSMDLYLNGRRIRRKYVQMHKGEGLGIVINQNVRHLKRGVMEVEMTDKEKQRYLDI